MHKQQPSQRILLLFTVTFILLLAVVVLVDGDKSRESRRQNNHSNHRGFQSKCGTSEQVAHQVGVCLSPIFDIVEGRFTEPSTDGDLVILCGRFTSAEKCLRGIARECLTGIHRTVTSAMASATMRLKNSECKNVQTRARYFGASKCCLKKGKDLVAVNKNHTAIAQVIRDLPNITPEEKILKVCCLINAYDRELESSLNQVCPKDAPSILNIFHSMTDDAKRTLCANPKCANVIQRLTPARLKQPQLFIEPVAQILYMLGVDSEGEEN